MARSIMQRSVSQAILGSDKWVCSDILRVWAKQSSYRIGPWRTSREERRGEERRGREEGEERRGEELRRGEERSWGEERQRRWDRKEERGERREERGERREERGGGGGGKKKQRKFKLKLRYSTFKISLTMSEQPIAWCSTVLFSASRWSAFAWCSNKTFTVS